MKKIISLLLTFSLLIIQGNMTWAADSDISRAIADTADFLYKTVKEPTIASVGGEWAVIGLKRSDLDIPGDFFDSYYNNVEKIVKDKKGILHSRKYTEYSRVIIALTAIGKNPESVAGYNLLIPLGDFENTVWQGINGAIWALIALDSGNYEIPENPDASIQATREMYVNHILEKQTQDGGWALSGATADPDITGMALQALSVYRKNERVQSAIDTALKAMSAIQDSKGGFSSFGASNTESCAQMLVALCSLGISVDDERFVKNGYTIVDNLLNYYTPSSGFAHDKDGLSLLATEQGLYGMVALKRAMEQKNSLYDMSDVKVTLPEREDTVFLKNRHADIKKTKVVSPGRTFSDIREHSAKASIEELASRGIIYGKGEDTFEPYSTMTRAEFATIITKSLGLLKKGKSTFSDVTEKDWFYDFVITAYEYGIIKGVSENEFNPQGTITREEAAVMVARASALCGMDTVRLVDSIRNTLSQFTDYVKSSQWSREALSFCYDENILDDKVTEIKPKEAITRAEIAYMLYNMLDASLLL